MCGEEKDEQLVLQIFAKSFNHSKKILLVNENQRNKMKYYRAEISFFD